ncbi:MAG: DUF2339 domain-containing protein [Ignavibacteriales bacterium]|nr:DUF2339 domain-containing protein [Ignavibacteriales bacterium]
MGESPENLPHEQFLEHLRALESRIARIEAHLDIPQSAPEEDSKALPATSVAVEDDEELELQVGQNWFAKVGIVGLALGIAFLLTMPYDGFPSFLPSLFGYALVGGIFLLSRYWRESFQQISRYLLGGGLLLLYFTTLRLSYFSPSPALTSGSLELSLLLLVVSVNILVAMRRASMYLAAFNLTLGYLTALLGGGTAFVLTVLAILSALTAYLCIRFHWKGLLTFGIGITYLTHFIWTANNPIFGHPLQFGLVPQIHLAFVLIYAMCFAAPALLREKDSPEDAFSILNSFVNGLLGFGVFAISTLAGPNGGITAWNSAASVVFLAVSIAFWVRLHSVYATFVYAMLGYAALSAAIVARFPMPDFFVWLCWQSILVVTTAVWFRSRFIVVANFVIYLIIFAAYLFAAPTVSSIGVSFGIVALLSARILNWQKNQLALRTEMMRNAYLASALLFLPYALYHSVPPQFVSASWLVLALFYYIGGRLLKSRKYRWMALLTMSLTILYLFIIDLTTVDPIVRIVSFLVVGSALLAISMVYSRKRRKTEPT